jgi:hypothetical protein
MLNEDLTPIGDQLAMQNLLEGRGGCIDTVEVADLLGLDTSIVELWRIRRQIVAVRNGDGQWVYPVWQFTRKHKRVMLGIRDCLAELAYESEWEPLIFFLSSMESLGGHSPLDRLRTGKIEAAILAARQYCWRKRASSGAARPISRS